MKIGKGMRMPPPGAARRPRRAAPRAMRAPPAAGCLPGMRSAARHACCARACRRPCLPAQQRQCAREHYATPRGGSKRRNPEMREKSPADAQPRRQPRARAPRALRARAPQASNASFFAAPRRAARCARCVSRAAAGRRHARTTALFTRTALLRAAPASAKRRGAGSRSLPAPWVTQQLPRHKGKGTCLPQNVCLF